MPETEKPTETSVLANIQRLVEQLNGEFAMAHEMGMKVSVSTRRLYDFGDHEWLSVRVWREQDLLSVPPPIAEREPLHEIGSGKMKHG